jgi:raffinose/stachyose/melibiose transport system substrate-binding protein
VVATTTTTRSLPPRPLSAETTGGESASDLEGTLRVLIHQNPPNVAFMEDFNEQFMADNPGVTIDMSIVNADDLNTVNQTRLTANDIDVTTISVGGLANPVQPFMEDVEPPAWQTLIEAGLLMDLTDQAFVENYDPTALADGGSFEDKRLRASARPRVVQRHVREPRPARRRRRRGADHVGRARCGL